MKDMSFGVRSVAKRAKLVLYSWVLNGEAKEQ